MFAEAVSRGPLDADPSDIAAIVSTVEHYRIQLVGHPLGRVFSRGRAPFELLKEFASLQYIDQVLWLPVLALMRDQVTNVRLRYVLSETENSHLSLCHDFVESLGVLERTSKKPISAVLMASALSEAQIAGWVLVSETLVPTLFNLALPAFEKVPGANVSYLRERILADGGEFTDWMLVCIEELLVSGCDVSDVLEGIHLGGRAALSVPDSLYSKFANQGYR